MKVGIDFDNTLVNTKEVSKKYLDLYMPSNNYQSYHELPKLEEEKFLAKYVLKITEDLTLYKGVKEAFAFFKENNIKPILITARGAMEPKLITYTKKFLEKENLEFSEMHFKCDDKAKVCYDNGIDLLIDDLEKNIALAKKKGISGLLMHGQSDKYPCVNSWDEIVKYIKKGLT